MNPDKRELLVKIARGTETWLRRCNGKPTQGIPMSRRQLLTALSASDAVATGTGGLVTWRAGGQQFTAEPVRDEGAPPASPAGT